MVVAFIVVVPSIYHFDVAARNSVIERPAATSLFYFLRRGYRRVAQGISHYHWNLAVARTTDGLATIACLYWAPRLWHFIDATA